MSRLAAFSDCAVRDVEGQQGPLNPLGWIEAHLTLLPTEEGGRPDGITTGYRPDWDIGNLEAGEPTINGAQVWTASPSDRSGCERRIEPGESGAVRLHPFEPEGWNRVHVGQRINMHEGPHVVGTAVVTRIERASSD